MESENISISYYENAVPAFAEAELERLYGNIYSSLAHHRIYGGIGDSTSTYVAQKNGRVTAVLLFQFEKNRVRVLNEQIRIAAEEIDRFAHHTFSAHPSVNVISFHAIDTEIARRPFPYQQFICTEDIVLALPGTAQEYQASLGKATRSYISRYLNKLKRNFPSLHYGIYVKEEISEQHVRSIIELNRARMAGKNKASYIDHEETERIIKLAQSYGLVSLMTIDGRICAGVINYRVGDNYFLKVIAHDPEYNDYRLGMLCCYLGIRDCIERGGKEYHFMWGQYEYKYRLMGIQRDLDHLAIYRSRTQFLLNGGMALRIALHGHAHQARTWFLHKARRQNNSGFLSRVAFHSLNHLRSLKQFTAGLLARQR